MHGPRSQPSKHRSDLLLERRADPMAAGAGEALRKKRHSLRQEVGVLGPGSVYVAPGQAEGPLVCAQVRAGRTES